MVCFESAVGFSTCCTKPIGHEQSRKMCASHHRYSSHICESTFYFPRYMLWATCCTSEAVIWPCVPMISCLTVLYVLQVGVCPACMYCYIKQPGKHLICGCVTVQHIPQPFCSVMRAVGMQPVLKHTPLLAGSCQVLYLFLRVPIALSWRSLAMAMLPTSLIWRNPCQYLTRWAATHLIQMFGTKYGSHISGTTFISVSLAPGDFEGVDFQGRGALFGKDRCTFSH